MHDTAAESTDNAYADTTVHHRYDNDEYDEHDDDRGVVSGMGCGYHGARTSETGPI